MIPENGPRSKRVLSGTTFATAEPGFSPFPLGAVPIFSQPLCAGMVGHEGTQEQQPEHGGTAQMHQAEQEQAAAGESTLKPTLRPFFSPGAADMMIASSFKSNGRPFSYARLVQPG
jgi:hypothetical protein